MKIVIDGKEAVIPSGSGGGSGGGGSGSAEEVYSTEETRIGTWIDGKPLYRVVMSGKPPTNDRTFKLGQIQTIDHVTFMHGISINSNGSVITVPYSNPSSYVYPAFNSSRDIMLNGTGLTTSNQYVLVVEYTKTTDQPED